jgi:hypothetical protein
MTIEEYRKESCGTGIRKKGVAYKLCHQLLGYP